MEKDLIKGIAQIAISPKYEKEFVEDLSLCIFYWKENYVPMNIRKLTCHLLNFAFEKMRLPNRLYDYYDKTMKIVNEEKKYYIKKAQKNIVLKVLHYLKQRQESGEMSIIDYARERISSTNFSKCLDANGNLEAYFVDLFSVSDTRVTFGINPGSPRITVYTNNVEKVKTTAEARLRDQNVLHNLDFVDYVHLEQPPDIKIEL